MVSPLGGNRIISKTLFCAGLWPARMMQFRLSRLEVDHVGEGEDVTFPAAAALAFQVQIAKPAERFVVAHHRPAARTNFRGNCADRWPQQPELARSRVPVHLIDHRRQGAELTVG
jgi:hypothetical protein